MPRPALSPSLADEQAAPGGVAAVDRALSLLAAFDGASPLLSLAELAERTRLYKSTVLRLLASLEHARLVRRHSDGRWGLGLEVGRLHQVYASSFSMEDVVMPALRALVAQTRESAAFHVRQGDKRLCAWRVDSPRPVRDHMKAGDLLPLDRGAGGRVLMAFSGARGPKAAKIRHDRVVTLVGDRLPELAGVSSPVFGPGDELLGALTLTMPSERLQPGFEASVLKAARQLTQALGGAFPGA
jgi:DNA-binding IclR family transcriptional regulator